MNSSLSMLFPNVNEFIGPELSSEEASFEEFKILVLPMAPEPLEDPQIAATFNVNAKGTVNASPVDKSMVNAEKSKAKKGSI
jgi:hypothetical protein